MTLRHEQVIIGRQHTGNEVASEETFTIGSWQRIGSRVDARTGGFTDETPLEGSKLNR